MKFYQIDSFTDELFRGNPAGVCLLDGDWPEETRMQQIAFENNLAETAFVRRRDGAYFIRWFSPLAEIFLCGHATLAAAHALFAHEGHSSDTVIFDSNRGELRVGRRGTWLTLDFPACQPVPVAYESRFDGCFAVRPREVYRINADYLFVYEHARDVADAVCDLGQIATLRESEGVVITARGQDCDFVSRCFCPQVGIDEDPVTGSAHTGLAVYWSRVLGKTELDARQLSARGGRLHCRLEGARVLISGKAVTYLKGELFV